MQLFDVYPLFDINITKGAGCHVWDDHGSEYLDLYGGHAVISIGHCHPHYTAMLTAQLSKLGFYSNSVINTLRSSWQNGWARHAVMTTISCFSSTQALRLTRTL